MPTTPTIPDGSKQMYINLYTGTGGSQTLTNNSPSNPAGFQSGLQWFKSRSNATDHVAHDVLRGTAGINRLFPNLTNAQSTTGDGFVSINSNGFSLDSSGTGGDVNTSGRTYVAWQWAAPATGTSNTQGTITSSVSANTTSGFSIFTFTGNGSSGATVGHGLSVLGVVPQMVIIKSLGNNDWSTYHVGIGNTKIIFLNSSNPTAGPNSAYWNNTTPSSTVVTLGVASELNGNGVSFVGYCFAPIAGYSAFGSYTGNGSTDGPFVYTGFRPRFILIKNSSVEQGWNIHDTSCNTYNLANLTLAPSNAQAEISSFANMDILSNGFKLRDTDGYVNGSGNTMIYAAFAENPFKYANAR
jgi:hypothetical protein